MGREPLLAAALVSGITLLVACKSKPEKICANLGAMIAKDSPDKKVTPEDHSRCVADIQSQLDQCANAETIATCYVDATTLDAIASCESKCQKKPGARSIKRGPSTQPESAPAPSAE